MRFSKIKHTLRFKVPGGTSRGVLNAKDSWIILAETDGQLLAVGECSIIPGLSPDPVSTIEDVIEAGFNELMHGRLDKSTLKKLFSGYPAVRFGFETLLRGLHVGHPVRLINSPFLTNMQGILINGLVWMGNRASMLRQIERKIEQGYTCIKLKIGAIDFDDECRLLQHIRKTFSADEIEIRVDANGAFTADEALKKLHVLAKYDVHSIEQPISPDQWDRMAVLSSESPIPIALDEELIGRVGHHERRVLLDTIQPQFIVLKPSLLGGIEASAKWIELADEMGISHWVTSALESNIGLNAIAQWTAKLKNPMPQGLGTGSLFTNNFESPLTIEKGHLYYKQSCDWSFEHLGPGSFRL